MCAASIRGSQPQGAPFCNLSSPALCFTPLPLAAAASFFCFSYKTIGTSSVDTLHSILLACLPAAPYLHDGA